MCFVIQIIMCNIIVLLCTVLHACMLFLSIIPTITYIFEQQYKIAIVYSLYLS